MELKGYIQSIVVLDHGVLVHEELSILLYGFETLMDR